MDLPSTDPTDGELSSGGNNMSNLFEPATVTRVKERIFQLKPDSERQWGKMAPAQAVAHCADAMHWAVGDVRPPRMLVGRLIGGLIKSKVLAEDAPMHKNSPTAKSLVIADVRDLAAEQKRLCGLIDRFAAAGPSGCTTHPHSFFGPLTPEQWATLMHKHLDHHLRQFGV
jgi:hypothetical protein